MSDVFRSFQCVSGMFTEPGGDFLEPILPNASIFKLPMIILVLEDSKHLLVSHIKAEFVKDFVLFLA